MRALEKFGSDNANKIGAVMASMGLQPPRFASTSSDAFLFKTRDTGPRGLVTRKTSARLSMPGNCMNRKTADDEGYPGEEIN